MDVLSHWLWGMAVTHGKIKGRFSGAMGVIPDLMAFVPVMIISVFTGHRNPSVDDTTRTEDFHPLSWEIYQWSHSAVTVLIGFLLTWYFLHKYGTPRFISRFYFATMSAKTGGVDLVALVTEHSDRYSFTHRSIFPNTCLSPNI